MTTDFKVSNTEYSNKNSYIYYKNTAKYAIAGATIVPILPLLDGDSLKEAYKNKHIGKIAGGAAFSGAFIGGSYYLTDKYVPSDKQIYAKSVIGAATIPLLLLITKWAEKGNKKPLNKKVCILGAALGAIIPFLTNKIKEMY